MREIHIEVAKVAYARRILDIQKKVYLPEAEIYDV